MIRKMTAIVLAPMAALVAAVPAQAAWHEASSEHFVIYADDSAKDVEQFAEQLERYHSAMEYLTGRQLETPSPSSRVTIYVVGNERDIRELYGNRKASVAGFYQARAGGSVAFVQAIKHKGGYPDFSTTVLLHEYAHHFLMSSSRFAMPRWLSEGAAEFYASASFPKKGGIQIGRPALHRGAELFHSVDVSIHELLDDDLYRKRRGRLHDAYYGRSWLLYHFLTFTENRRGQLTCYWEGLTRGADSTETGTACFGDLDQLQQELDRYLNKRRMMSIALPPDRITTGPVSIRELSEGHGKAMPMIIRSKRGVNEESAAELVVEVREVAQRFPNDPSVLSALAEAEHDAGNHDAAIVAADRAIAIDPGQKNAYVQMAYSLFAKAEDADDIAAAADAAMLPFSKLNALENDHPLPLIYYYRSYAMKGEEPPENARHALERASQLAPFDQGLTLEVANMLAAEGKITIARAFLGPVAANPHGGGIAKYAQTMRSQLADHPEGTPYFPTFVALDEVEVEAED